MTQSAPVIVWFRRDLRLHDNPALTAAIESGHPVICLYILDETPSIRPLGAASRWWLGRSLEALAKDLSSLGCRLVLRRGLAKRELMSVVDQTAAGGVYWNRVYEPQELARDIDINSELKRAGLESYSYNSALFHEPGELLKKDRSHYQVFTPYWRAGIDRGVRSTPLPHPMGGQWYSQEIDSNVLESWRMAPNKPDWTGGFVDWRPGEQGARRRLDDFLNNGARTYESGRDAPALQGTSRLSPHLHFGEIGPRQISQSIAATVAGGILAESAAVAYERQLVWREFNYQVLFHNPELPASSLKSNFESFPWKTDTVQLAAWRNGRTGYPIVDAGMRELWTTGWMHNRVRMLVASFLTKHLLIDWRLGEAWFWDTLVDADLANNVGNWQWVAGSGADAAPYFRIFNPGLQSARHDPNGDYIRRWTPELIRLPAEHIHEPWKAPPLILAEAGVRLGVTYPMPIVDHGEARQRALDAYRTLDSNSLSHYT